MTTPKQIASNLMYDFGLQSAAKYAHKIADYPGPLSSYYARAAGILQGMIDHEYQRRLELLAEIARLPAYHPVEGDLGSVPL